jgi:hypothetical protein
MSTALQSRMVHIEVDISLDEWLDWAHTNGIDTRITSFLQYRPSYLCNFDPKHSDFTYSCPRTLDMLSQLTKGADLSELTELIDGTIGKGASAEYRAFTKYYEDIPKLKDIIDNPATCELPTGGLAFALCGLITENMTSENCERLMEYVRRMPSELHVVILRGSFRRTPGLRKVPAFSKLLVEVGTKFC